MKLLNLLFFLCLVLPNINGQAQSNSLPLPTNQQEEVNFQDFLKTQQGCGTSDDLLDSHQNASEKQEFSDAYEKTWKDYQQRVIDGSFHSATKTVATYRLPIVIHIIHDCSVIGILGANPSDTRVTQIINETNERFRHLQPDAPIFTNPFYGADADIELCLATVDPSGNYTTGIIRHNNAALSSGVYQDLIDPLANAYNWPTDEYCNIYLVDQITNAGGVYSPAQDIVLINTGSFWSGLTVHEVGHYFGLGHTFGSCTNGDCLNNGDRVCDTPPKGTSGFANGTCDMPADNCTTDEDDTSVNNPYRSVSEGGMGNQVDMLSNYMDYSINCWDAFSVGQAARMHTSINTIRTTQLDAFATKCAVAQVPDNQVSLDYASHLFDKCNNTLDFTINFTNKGMADVTSVQFNLSFNNETYTHNWTGSIANSESTQSIISVPPPANDGMYDANFVVSQVNGQPDAFNNDSDMCHRMNIVRDVTFPYIESLDNSCIISPDFSIDSSNDDFFRARTYHQSDLNECLGCKFSYIGYNSSPETAELCLSIIDVSSLVTPELKFDYGHIARYSSISNKLSVKLKECDDTETVLWTREGLNLSTNNPKAYESDGSDGVYPFCDEIEEVIVPFTALDNLIRICFETEGRFYSTMNIDNIEVRDASILPIELTSFTAKPKKSTNLIEWETSYESETDIYILERSLNQRQDFEQIHTIEASNQEQGELYFYEDDDKAILDTEQVYYRLTTQYFDGSKERVGIKSINRKVKNNQWSVYPNIIKAGETLHLLGDEVSIETYLFDLNGKKIFQQSFVSDNSKKMQLPNLPSGIYFLSVIPKNNSNISILKIVIE